MILKFDLFTEIAIEVLKYLNTRIYDFNPPNTDENYQMRYYSYITNTIEEDKEILREMFIPTQKEILRNQVMNDAARKKQLEMQKEKIQNLKDIKFDLI